jgi:predicted dehydrogenase
MLRAESERANSWWFERSKGGGLSGAILSHLLDHATWLAGRMPVRATGFERTANPTRTFKGTSFTSDVADGAFAVVDYGDGLIARVSADGTRAIDSFLAAVHGESRTAVASGRTMIETTLYSVDAEETAELQCSPHPHATLAAAHPNLPAFVSLLDDFARAIAGESTVALPTFDVGLTTQKTLASLGFEVTATPAR